MSSAAAVAVADINAVVGVQIDGIVVAVKEDVELTMTTTTARITVNAQYKHEND